MSSPTTQDTLTTLRRCIGALMACEERLRDDLENLKTLESETADQSMDYDLREALAQLAAMTVAEARATSECLQAQAQAAAKKGGAA